MATSKEKIRRWFLEGKKKSATHMIVVCDTFDYEDFPVFVMPNENVRQKYEEYDKKDMQKVMEVYSLKESMEDQLREHRAFHFD